jgi:RNA polymerase sigma factor (sigma-70 family)
MNEQPRDFELLRALARRGDQQAFAAIVQRHLNLVYATALRKAQDPSSAEEISQDVFAVLARNAWQFGPGDSVPAWLYRTTLLKAKAWLRSEIRRRRREQAAAELGTTMKTPDDQPALRTLIPLLDEALLSLREKDRSVLLLRYYESRSLRDVGAALNVGEDAAQKRVAGALDKLTLYFQRCGFRAATTAATAAALELTAAPASSVSAATIAYVALQSAKPTLAGIVPVLARLAGLSKAQIAGLCLILAAPAGLQWVKHRASAKQAAAVQLKAEAAEAQQAQLSVELGRLLTLSARLERSLADTAERQTRNQENARKIEALKTRIQGLLAGKGSPWPDDLPFARVPKSALTSIDFGPPWLPQGPTHLQPKARELFAFTPDESEKAESSLSNYFSHVNELIDSHIYETNGSALLPVWSSARAFLSNALVSKVFIIPALGTEIKDSAARLRAELTSTLGEERVKLLAGRSGTYQTYPLLTIMNLNAADQIQQIIVSVAQKENRQLIARYFWGQDFSGQDGIMMMSREAPLSGFLPNAPSDDKTQATSSFGSEMLPVPFNNRIQQWLMQQAAAHL